MNDVLKIELDQTATIVTVQTREGFIRKFAAATLQPRDIESFLEDVDVAAERVRQCRAIFMAGGNVIPFPKVADNGEPEPETTH